MDYFRSITDGKITFVVSVYVFIYKEIANTTPSSFLLISDLSLISYYLLEKKTVGIEGMQVTVEMGSII